MTDAVKAYEKWLADPDISDEIKAELRSIRDDANEIEERFYRELEFGTAGLRGVIGAGTNRMNVYTVAKATKGLADYINGLKKDGAVPSVAVAYDSRHKSSEFAAAAVEILNANGIRTYVFEDIRPTPELSFAIRELGCVSGVNITASHNPAKYNGYKVYWSDGAQISEPDDTGITACVNAVTDVPRLKKMAAEEARKQGLYVEIGREIDEKYIAAISAQVKEEKILRENAGNVKVVYTPLHGVGVKIIPEVLGKFGFENLYIVKEQAKPDGNFPTVEFPNPEIPETFELADKLGRETGADLIIASDPDSDRLGVHVRDAEGNIRELSGNVIGCLLCEYELSRLAAAGHMPKDAFITRSIVSSRLIDDIAHCYGAEVREVLTGFKWVGREIRKAEQAGNGTFVYGYEESYGYLIGTHARDKDACVTALAMCEACAFYKSVGKTLWDAVQDMYEKYGYAYEDTVSIIKEGRDGQQEIADIMKKLRNKKLSSVAGEKVVKAMDLEKPDETGFLKSDVLFYDLENGAWACVRPSGTEPKIKYYIGVREKNEKAAKEKVERIRQDMVNMD